jgi:hypothetical protein
VSEAPERQEVHIHTHNAVVFGGGNTGPMAFAGPAPAPTAAAPPSLDAERAYLAYIEGHLRDLNLGDLTYVGLHGAQTGPAAAQGDYVPDDLAGERQQLRTIRRQVWLLRDEIEGGEQATAQLAAASRTAKLLNDVTAFLERTREPVVLLGDPGSGKSTTLREVGIRVAQRGIRGGARGERPIIPVYVALGAYGHASDDDSPADVMDLVRRAIPDSQKAIRDALPALAAQSRLLVIFDGMDEMERTVYARRVEKLSRFARDYRGQVKCLFACRTNDFLPSFAHRQIVLMPFDRRQVLAYVEANFRLPVVIDGVTFRARALTRKLMAMPELGEAVTNPMTLNLIRLFVESRNRWPSGRSELFEAYVDSFVVRFGKFRGMPLTADDAEATLADWAALAFEIARARGGVFLEVGRLRTALGKQRADHVLDRGFRGGLLTVRLAEQADDAPVDRELPLREGDSVGFFHHRIQEYLCAVHLVRHYDAADALDWDSLLDSPRWQETLLHVVAARGLYFPAIGVLATSLDDASREIAEGLQARLSFMDEGKQAGEALKTISKDVGVEKDSAAYKAREAELSASIARIDARVLDLRWPLRPDRERVLANRIVLAARLFAEPSAVPRDAGGGRVERPVTVPEPLAEKLRGAVRAFATDARPTSQVKMLWAWRDASVLIPLECVEVPLRSRIAWVRDQALLVFGALAPRRPRGVADLATEVEYDFANGSLLARAGTYLKAARDSPAGLLLLVWCLGWALAQVAASIALGFFIIRGTVGMIPPPDWETFGPGASAAAVRVATVLALIAPVSALIGGGGGVLGYGRRAAVYAGIGASAIAILAELLAPVMLLHGQWEVGTQGGVFDLIHAASANLFRIEDAQPFFFEFIGSGHALLALVPAMLGSAISFLIVGIAFVCLSAPRLLHDGVRTFAPSRLLPLGDTISLAETCVWFGVAGCGTVFVTTWIIEMIARLWTAEMTLGVIVLGAAAICFAMYRFGLRIVRKIALWAFLAVLSIGTILHWPYGSEAVHWLLAVLRLDGIIARLEPWWSEYDDLRRGVFVAMVGIAGVLSAILNLPSFLRSASAASRYVLDHLAYFCITAGLRVPFLLGRIPATQDAWLAAIREGSPYRQAYLLATLSRDRLGLASPRDLLILIESCEPQVMSEPAQGFYWRRRHELEESLRQENRVAL